MYLYNNKIIYSTHIRKHCSGYSSLLPSPIYPFLLLGNFCPWLWVAMEVAVTLVEAVIPLLLLLLLLLTERWAESATFTCLAMKASQESTKHLYCEFRLPFWVNDLKILERIWYQSKSTMRTEKHWEVMQKSRKIRGEFYILESILFV